jgi:hypothetical protein
MDDKRRKISQLIYLSDLGGVGHVRCIFPSLLLNSFRSDKYIFNSWYLNYFVKDIEIYSQFTYVIFQRSATKRHMELVDMFKKKIKKLTRTGMIYEIDDSLLNIPDWNYAHQYYESNKPYVEFILANVDGIVVSTQPLKELYSKYNNNIQVIPNHLPKFLWGEPTFQENNNKKLKIIFPGSMNHFATPNLKVKGGDMGQNLMDFIRKTIDKYDWNFIGGIPQEFNDLKNNGKIIYHEWKSIFEYPSFLKSLCPDIGIAPLENIPFNAGKSNLKNLEYCAIGIPGIYSNVYPYKDTTYKATTDEEFIGYIEKLEDVDERYKVWNQDCKKVEKQLFWEDNNNITKYINSHLKLFNKEIKF